MRFFPLVSVAGLLFCLASALAGAQKLDCKPCYYSFGEVKIRTASSHSIELSNRGKRTLRIFSRSERGPSFSFGVYRLPMKLRPGARIWLPIIFTPTEAGKSYGTLTLGSNDPNSPLHIRVQGTGIAPVHEQLELTPATLNFGKVTVGSSATLQVTLTACNGAVTISSDESTSSEFAIVGLALPVTISSGKSIAVSIQFTPNASGTASGKAEFISNAADSPTIGLLTGTGVAQSSHNVYLSWEAGGGSPVGYDVFRGTAQGGPFEQINSALDSSTNYTDYTVVSGTTYYYVVTAVNAEGEESVYSNVVQAVIPNP
jgi:hypothetical protein